jgi:hypothetical protein
LKRDESIIVSESDVIENTRNSRLQHNPSGMMAYVNTSLEGNKPVGPIGLKKAEKELIQRRYNYQVL